MLEEVSYILRSQHIKADRSDLLRRRDIYSSTVEKLDNAYKTWKTSTATELGVIHAECSDLIHQLNKLSANKVMIIFQLTKSPAIVDLNPEIDVPEFKSFEEAGYSTFGIITKDDENFFFYNEQGRDHHDFIIIPELPEILELQTYMHACVVSLDRDNIIGLELRVVLDEPQIVEQT